MGRYLHGTVFPGQAEAFVGMIKRQTCNNLSTKTSSASDRAFTTPLCAVAACCCCYWNHLHKYLILGYKFMDWHGIGCNVDFHWIFHLSTHSTLSIFVLIHPVIFSSSWPLAVCGPGWRYGRLFALLVLLHRK